MRSLYCDLSGIALQSLMLMQYFECEWSTVVAVILTITCTWMWIHYRTMHFFVVGFFLVDGYSLKEVVGWLVIYLFIYHLTQIA